MLAEQGAQAAQSDGIATLLSAREKQRLDIGAMHEMMLAKFNELPKGGIYPVLLVQQPAVGTW